MKTHSSYLPALDGIRALSILLVLFEHVGFFKIPGGFGVTIFFYISGLLITKLLLDEYKNNGRIKLKDFYIRRLLRLYPPILFLILITVSVPVLRKSTNGGELMAALFYYENYFIVYNYEAMKDFAGLGFFWSLSVEEHFYLIFPYVFLSLIKFHKTLIWVIIAAIVVSLINRIYITFIYHANDYSWMYTYVVTTCRADSILAGCLTSILISFDSRKLYLNFVSKKTVFLGAFGLLILAFSLRSDFFKQTFRFSLQSISLIAIIPPILYSGKFVRIANFLSATPLVFIGKLSYSLYLFNHAAYMLVDAFIAPQKLSAKYISCSLITVFLLSLLSYNLIERPVMKWRRKFGSEVRISKDDTAVTAQG